jgi:hypothetical protein
MTEPLPAPQDPSEPLAYQPISGWAIAGLATGGLFTLLVAISAAVAFFQGAPFFFPVWIIGVAILGVAVSLYAQRHVQYSEGTRAGAKLARWGFRLSLISGLMYSVYYFVTKSALENQANDFVMEMKDDAGFFPRLREGLADFDHPHRTQLNYAFLLTQAPNARGARPENERDMRRAYDGPVKDGASGELTNFRESLLARILYKHLAKDAEITPLEVLDWRYEKSSYKISRTYRIKTKEIEMDFVLAVYSAEAESAGGGRKWSVNLRESGPKSMKLTPLLGEGVRRLRQHSNDWLRQRIKSLSEGKPFADFKHLDRTDWDVLVIEAKNQDERLTLQKQHHTQVLQILAGQGELKMAQFEVLTRADQPGKWEQVDGKIRMYPIIRFALRKMLGPLPMYQYEAIATLESKQPIDPASFKEDAPPPDWDLISVEVTAVTSAEPKVK